MRPTLGSISTQPACTGNARAALLLGAALAFGAMLAVLALWSADGLGVGSEGATRGDTAPKLEPEARVLEGAAGAPARGAAGEERLEALTQDEARTHVLRVDVFGPNATPWSGPFELWVEHLAPPGTRSSLPGRFTSERGPSARVEGLALGEYLVFARSGGRRSGEARVRIDTDRAEARARVELASAGAIRGRFTCDGEGLDGVEVRLRSSNAQHVEATVTDGEGRFVFDAVLDGTWQLFVGPLHDPIAKDWILEHRGIELDLGERAFDGLATLHVHVRDAHGRPIAGARVHDGALSGHFDLRTDEHGNAKARHLPPRQYRVFAEHAEHGRTNLPIRVESRADANLELELPN